MTKRQSWCSTFVAFCIELNLSFTYYRQPRLFKNLTFLGGTVLSPIFDLQDRVDLLQAHCYKCLCYKLPKFTFEARITLLVKSLQPKIRIVCLENIYDRKSYRRNYFRFISPLFRMSRVSDFSPNSNNNNRFPTESCWKHRKNLIKATKDLDITCSGVWTVGAVAISRTMLETPDSFWTLKFRKEIMYLDYLENPTP